MRPSFYPLEQFPQLQPLLENWRSIREEFFLLDAPLMSINREGKDHDQVYFEVREHIQNGGEYGWLQGWGKDGPNPDWLQYALVVHDVIVPFVDKMPTTLKLLSEIKGVKVCALLTMKPQTMIPTHRHPEIYEDGLLQLHLTLDTASEANYAYLNVNGEFRRHQRGEAMVFDGSLDHFAINASDGNRTILYMEFEVN